MITLSGFLVCTTAEEAARVRAHLPDHVALTRAEPGCLSFQVTPTDDPLIWRVEETFTDRPALNAHQTRAARSAWAEATAGIRRDYTIRED
ncbi:putative quinol monooxygenase [Gemmobacter nectariphilus]|uniref:putative quinol monooxygenase n=1 Tax=Gemmobacter nectariphilus TaxID=220343 RepID=UPI0004079770|nr:antibiotic biosynthesis monooxygenase [Gemmobacter nectariphilus]